MYVRKPSDAALPSPDPPVTDEIGRLSGLGHNGGGLCADRLAALPGLPQVEQLIHDQDRDQ